MLTKTIVAKFISTDTKALELINSKNLRFDELLGKLIIEEPSSSSSMDNATLRNSFENPYPVSVRHLPSGSTNTTIQTVDFSMSIYSPNPQNYDEPIHRCTRVQSNVGAQPKSLEEAEDWRTYFPALAEKIQERSCELVLMQVNLSVMDEVAPRSVIAICHDVVLSGPVRYVDWQVRTTFYEDKGNQKAQFHKRLRYEDVDHDSTKLYDIPFESKLWMKTLEKTISRRLELKQSEDQKLQQSGHGDW